MDKQRYTGPERRKSPRKEESVKIEYVLEDDLETKELNKTRVTYSRNIGGGGLCIYLNEDIDFNVGTQMYMIINLPEKKKVFIFVQVVYVNPVKGKGYKYMVGVRYINISDEDRKVIMDFVTK